MKIKLLPLIVLLLGIVWHQAASKSDLSRDATKLLDTLFDSKKYDRRVRPNFGGAPVDVSVTVYVGNVDTSSKSSLDLDIYLRQSWFDDRLVFNKSTFSPSTLTLPNDYPAIIWLPDTFFPSSKSVVPAHGSSTTPAHSFCRISQDGKVLWSQRLEVAVICPMDLRLFPFDVHECLLEMESYAYSDTDIKYSWDNKGAASVDSTTAFIPSMEIVNYGTRSQTTALSTGNYSRISLRFLLRRRSGYYVMQFHTPLAMLTILSWLSFWLDRGALTAKMLASLIPLATATMLTLFSNSPLTGVDYIKSLDVYSGFCLLLIFSSLAECAIANYFDRKTPPSCQLTNSNGKYNDSNASGMSNENAATSKYASNLDLFCRAVFPVVFVIFNALYWLTCSSLANNALRSLVKAGSYNMI